MPFVMCLVPFVATPAWLQRHCCLEGGSAPARQLPMFHVKQRDASTGHIRSVSPTQVPLRLPAADQSILRTCIAHHGAGWLLLSSNESKSATASREIATVLCECEPSMKRQLPISRGPPRPIHERTAGRSPAARQHEVLAFSARSPHCAVDNEGT